jgi:hypothetical protein
MAVRIWASGNVIVMKPITAGEGLAIDRRALNRYE